MADRVVYDTNVMIGATLWSGAPYRAVLLARAQVVQAVYCDDMLAELTETLRAKFHFDENHIQAVAYRVRQYSERVEITGSLHRVADDPDDDKFLECASVASARWIVSDDHHLLALGEYEGTQIIGAHDFLIRLASEASSD